MALILNNITIESRTSDNFVNATQLCKAGGKKFNDWYRLDSTKELIKELENSLSIKNLIDIKKGRYNSGSWIHPDLAVQLAQWISPSFAIQVSRWVREWRSYSIKNEKAFHQALNEITPSKKTLKEKEIQNKLVNLFKAMPEIETPAGRIDLLANDKIIEIKESSHWKHAIGQILSYGIFYPNHKKIIYLFGEIKEKNIIEKICSIYDIEVMYD